MKSDIEKRFQTKVIMHILYSLFVTIIVEILILANLNLLSSYIAETQEITGWVVSTSKVDVAVILLFVLLAIGIFTIIFVFLQRKSFSYIDEISRAMRDISSGDLDVNLPIKEDDQFSDMALNINRMASDIRILMEKERESERQKNELITNVAHDLRTPLTSIIGYLDLISNHDQLDEKTRKQYTQVAYTKAKRLEKLIEDLFGFTKLNYGKMAMKLEKIDIVKLLSQLMEEFYPNFENKQLAFDLQSNVVSFEINADGILLSRLFDNLINNAIKYGSDGKRINVKIMAKGERVWISVINYGKVIPADELPYIFDKFYRVEQSRSTTTGGTGLGLAIAKNIVHMHHGSIEVSSDLGGTEFKVMLPIDLDVEKENFTHA